jgi:hypothetical protein
MTKKRKTEQEKLRLKWWHIVLFILVMLLLFSFLDFNESYKDCVNDCTYSYYCDYDYYENGYYIYDTSCNDCINSLKYCVRGCD